MNMISEIRNRVSTNGSATITVDEFNQLQREWITRTGAEDVAKVERERGLNEALGEIALMYDKVDQASPLHKGMRMALSSAYDRVMELMKPNTEAMRHAAKDER